MLEKLIDKAKNAMKEALVYAEKITDGRTMSEKDKYTQCKLLYGSIPCLFGVDRGY